MSRISRPLAAAVLAMVAVMVGDNADHALTVLPKFVGAWVEVPANSIPYVATAMAYDGIHGTLVAELATPDFKFATASFDGVLWSVFPSQSLPVQNTGDSLVTDEATGELFAFDGSQAAPGTSPCAYVWSGNAWVQRSCAPPPPPFSDSAFVLRCAAYDPVNRDFVVVIDNETPSTHGSFVDRETWKFDGMSWSHLSTGGSGSAPGGTAVEGVVPAATDDATGTVVAFNVSDTTWIWNGHDWHTANAPAGEQIFATNLTYDPTTGTVLRYTSADLVPARTDEAGRETVRWQGSQWVPVFTSGLSPATGAVAYDPRLGAVVLLGLSDGVTPRGSVAGSSTTWKLRPVSISIP